MLTACAGTPYSAADQLHQLEFLNRGLASNEVVDRLGQPPDTYLDGLVWIYDLHRNRIGALSSRSAPGDTARYQLVLVFAADTRLERFNLIEAS